MRKYYIILFLSNRKECHIQEVDPKWYGFLLDMKIVGKINDLPNIREIALKAFGTYKEKELVVFLKSSPFPNETRCYAN
jgi:hypothetical protein